MLKLFLFSMAIFVISGCTESSLDEASDSPSPQQKNATSHIISEPISVKDNNPPQVIGANKSIDISVDFAEPDSKNNALFDDIISKIIEKNTQIDFSSAIDDEEYQLVESSCQKIDKKLASVTLKECMSSNLRASNFRSRKDFPILLTEFPPLEGRESLGKILVIGGTHGDELTSISIIFKWMTILKKYHSGLFHWRIAPLMNPDGALTKRATRPNNNNIDLNRNMPTPDWHRLSSERWQKIGKDPRKNPGIEPASEPETQWLIHQIEAFKPDAIVSVHAPYGILDFDSPDLTKAPKSFGRLRLNLLGTYPGSLGNYAGITRDIPVLTLELPHAWVMPKPFEINEIWSDMIKWLKLQLEHN